MPLGPAGVAIMFVVGGVGMVTSFAAFGAAQQIGPNLKASDLLPMPPPYPPVPRFLYKPEVMESLRKK
ncbi:hypothetical protein ES703_125606 [subsurface metagenome]